MSPGSALVAATGHGLGLALFPLGAAVVAAVFMVQLARRYAGAPRRRPAEIGDQHLCRLGRALHTVERDFVDDVADVAALTDRIREIGHLAPAPLLLTVRPIHHVGVEADPAGDREIAPLAVDLDATDVDTPRSPMEGDVDGVGGRPGNA